MIQIPRLLTWFMLMTVILQAYIMRTSLSRYMPVFRSPSLLKENRSKSDYHAGELPYMYGNLWRYPSLYSESDKKLSDTMVKYVANFVKTGDPNGDGLPKWEKYSSGSQLLQLNDEIKMMDDPNNEIYKIIDKCQESVKGQS